MIMERTYENILSSYFFYMWNSWTREECAAVFGPQYEHYWSKWCNYAEPSATGAAEEFYAALSDNNRRKLADRACALYDGNSLATSPPSPKPQVVGVLVMLVGVLDNWWACQDYETQQSITGLTDEGFVSLDEHDRAMNDYWKELPVEEKISLWHRFSNQSKSKPTIKP